MDLSLGSDPLPLLPGLQELHFLSARGSPPSLIQLPKVLQRLRMAAQALQLLRP
jgi:hypothetical protein